jgi:cyclophilin family peptidyl-prolyl cis-trans isomerase
VGTEKRERQKANRQLKYEQQAKEQQRRKLTRTIMIGVGAVVGGLALVLFLAWAFNRGDDDDTPATTTVAPTTPSTAAASTPAAAPGEPTIVPFTYGDGPCPPEQVSEPVKDFDAAPQLCIDPEATYTARFVTNMGDIVVDLDTADVPGTVNNFVTLAQYGYYDDTLIFRTDPSIGILQGGGQDNSQSPGYEIPDEGTGFTYHPGQLVMARTAQPNSAGGQWFFTVNDAAAALDGQGTYVVFGEVTEGLDITEQMLALAPANGDTPTETITVERVEITQS